MLEYRVFAGWDNGAYVTSEDPDFHKSLNEMIAQFGRPTTLEVRHQDEGKIYPGNDDELLNGTEW